MAGKGPFVVDAWAPLDNLGWAFVQDLLFFYYYSISLRQKDTLRSAYDTGTLSAKLLDTENRLWRSGNKSLKKKKTYVSTNLH